MQIYKTLFIISLLVFYILPVSKAANIALIIDDIGNNKHEAAAFDLPLNVTFAILPNKPLSGFFSERALNQRREVIIHMPMESLAGIKQEEASLVAGMTDEQISSTLTNALASVPFATGLNNHMGSRLTQLEAPMKETMSFLFKHGLYFVDSRTTHFSRAEKIAHDYGVLATKRDVFLDHVADLPNIQKQFNRLISLAKKHGQAVGIAHPYPQTLQFLKEQLPTIESQGIKLVKLSDMIIEQRYVAKSETVNSDDFVATQ
ncbi:divergent polysaccharide deacetylase family protein [Paraglaciecola sp.]|uniref:divergent polysaccharide deacetylase family protein n=1 Tax=Paraglaciecola sp. TaxID=1920173 RepID=UPI00273DC5C7|nr:divergent polysaccharide deacetylase family protein [Paraglaciecola sp.]MDP5031507.1 divergent polysaccharide deacetylase family protein [Paraglaciecola sp.]